MTKLSKKQNKIAVGIWAFIALVIILSSSVIEFLANLGIEAANANLLIVVGVILLAYYHVQIAKEVSG